MRRVAFLISAALLSALLLPGGALANSGAGGEKSYIDEGPFVSGIWSAHCGFPVVRTNKGHERIWEQPRGNRVIFRGVFAITITLTGPTGRTYKFQDAGTDRGTLLADSRVQLAVIGRSFPVNSIGRLVEVDGEVVKVSGRTAYDPQQICARIAP